MTRLFLLGIALLVASTCSRSPSLPAPVPVVIPPDAGPVVVTATCLDAYNRMSQLHCPPEEDAHEGWISVDCPKLSPKQVARIINSATCVQTRQAQEAP